MTRQRTKKAYRRSRKFKKKFTSREVNLAFKENIVWYVPHLRDYLRLDNLLEKETLDLLDKNVKLGLIKEGEKDLYLAFWRKIRQLGQRFSDKTLEERIEEVLEEFITRGLVKEKLEEIIDLVKDQLERKKVFEKTEEWATLIDYLKLKAIAFVIVPSVFEKELVPIIDFKLITSVIPPPKFSTEIKNFLRLQFNAQVIV
jgi:hypothetical protein